MCNCHLSRAYNLISDITGGDLNFCHPTRTSTVIGVSNSPTGVLFDYSCLPIPPLLYHKWCLAFQVLFRAVVPRRGLCRNISLRYFDSFPIKRSPLVPWALGLTLCSWIHISYPLLTRDGWFLLSRIVHFAAFRWGFYSTFSTTLFYLKIRKIINFRIY